MLSSFSNIEWEIEYYTSLPINWWRHRVGLILCLGFYSNKATTTFYFIVHLWRSEVSVFNSRSLKLQSTICETISYQTSLCETLKSVDWTVLTVRLHIHLNVFTNLLPTFVFFKFKFNIEAKLTVESGSWFYHH